MVYNVVDDEPAPPSEPAVTEADILDVSYARGESGLRCACEESAFGVGETSAETSEMEATRHGASELELLPSLTSELRHRQRQLLWAQLVLAACRHLLAPPPTQCCRRRHRRRRRPCCLLFGEGLVQLVPMPRRHRRRCCLVLEL